MRKTALSRARVGLLIFIGMMAFSIGIFFIGEKSQLFSRAFYVKVNFSSVEGVKPGANVMLSGYNIGTVTDISLTQGADSIRLLMRIDHRIRDFVKTDSKAEIKQEGLVGNKFISIRIGSPDAAEVPDYGFIDGVPPFALSSFADNFISIADTVKMVSNEVNIMLRRLNRGEGTMGKLFTDDELYQRLVGVTADTEHGLQQLTQQIDRLADRLSGSMDTFDSIAVKVDTVMGNSIRITERAASLLGKVDDEEGTLGLLLSDRTLYDSLVTFLNALTDVTYDAGNAAQQTARSIHAMREHWLFGRVFAGEDFEDEEPIQSSYTRKMRELQRRLEELERLEAELRQREAERGKGQPAQEGQTVK